MNTHFDIKKNFPIFENMRQTSGELVYLDSAATTQKPSSVIGRITQFYSTQNATVHRALYPLGEIATTDYENARCTVASFINARHTEEIIFTNGTTEGVNFIATAWALDVLKPGDEIVLTQAEHHANLLPWQWVAEKTGARLVFIPIDTTSYQLINPKSYITPKIKLLSITHSSNVLGPIWDEQAHELESCIALAKQHGACVLVDAAQAVAHHKLDVQALGADFVAFSGHKMFGPTGIGVLYITKALHGTVQPYQRGGSMVHEAQFTSATWAKSPYKFEAGTPPIAAALGLASAIEYINSTINFGALEVYEAALCTELINGLETIEDITIVGNTDTLKQKGHLVSLAFKNVHPHDIATYLGSRGIAVRAGHFCAQPLVTALGFESLLRISLAAYNTPQDVKTFLQELQSCLNLFKKALQE